MNSVGQRITTSAKRLPSMVAESATQGLETVAGRLDALTKNDQVVEIIGGITGTGVSLAAKPQFSEKLDLFQKGLDAVVSGEGFVSDLLVTAGEVAYKKLRSFGGFLHRAVRFAMDSGLAAAIPVGLGVLAPPLLIGGAKQLVQGIKEKKAMGALQGGRKMILAGEIGAVATQLAPPLTGTVLARTVAAAAVPLAIAQIALDTVQGTYQMVQGVRNKEASTVVSGLSDLGIATALTVGLAAGPAAALPVVCTALALKVGHGYMQSREEKQKRKTQVITSLKSGAEPNFWKSIDLAGGVSMSEPKLCS